MIIRIDTTRTFTDQSSGNVLKTEHSFELQTGINDPEQFVENYDVAERGQWPNLDSYRAVRRSLETKEELPWCGRCGYGVSQLSDHDPEISHQGTEPFFDQIG